MIFLRAPLDGSYLIDLEPFQDERGWFARTFCKKDFLEIGHTKEWVQMNHSATFKKGSIRGMHYQVAPYREIKMVRCVSGVVLDVVVDLRKDSSTYLKHFGVELSAANRRMIYIPEGFAHGFQCLTDDCHLLYHHSEYYAPGAEGGLRFNDPALGIDWPLPVTEISARDQSHPLIDNHFKGL